MSKNTHCTVQTFKGESWSENDFTGSLSGTPEGVIEMLFENIARYDKNLATNTLFRLHETLAYENQIRPAPMNEVNKPEGE